MTMVKAPISNNRIVTNDSIYAPSGRYLSSIQNSSPMAFRSAVRLLTPCSTSSSFLTSPLLLRKDNFYDFLQFFCHSAKIFITLIGQERWYHYDKKTDLPCSYLLKLSTAFYLVQAICLLKGVPMLNHNCIRDRVFHRSIWRIHMRKNVYTNVLGSVTENGMGV